MMKNIIYIFGFVISIACNSSQKNDVSEIDQLGNAETDSIKITKPEFDLNGTWGLTNYFDTIVEQKEIAKYRLQAPTWFGIILQINNDSLIAYGSLIEEEKQLNLKSDTLTLFDSYGGKWDLIKKEELLLLTQSPNQKKKDTTVYIYRKRNDLDFMTQNMDEFHKINSNITKYFNDKLLAGTYQNIKENKDVIFQPNGEVIGFKKYDTYQVRNYFGTLHPHKNLDVFTFFNSTTKESKQYNWNFSDGHLILTDFISETILDNGEKIVTDDYILGTEKIELKILSTTKPKQH
jgi:hypothetical protein